MKSKILNAHRKLSFVLAAALALLLSCSRVSTISFCEGTNAGDGSGVNCGTIFTPGELSAVFRLRGVKEDARVEFVVYEVNGTAKQRLSTTPVDVKADNKYASANLIFYNSGVYEVNALLGDKVIAVGTLEIRGE